MRPFRILLRRRPLSISAFPNPLTMSKTRSADTVATDEHASKRMRLENRRVTTMRPLVPPACVIAELPVTPEVHATVTEARDAVADILHGKDDRLVVVVGPCSIHDVTAAMDYGTVQIIPHFRIPKHAD